MSRIARLIEDAGAVKRGEFELSSGARTNFYIDKYVFETQPEVLASIAEAIAQRLEGADVDVLAGPELGAVPLVTAVSLETGLPAAYIRKASKGYGTDERVEGTIEPGDRVAVLEDVTTTGSTLLDTVAFVESLGAVVERVIVVCDRNAGAVEQVREAGHELEPLVQVGEDLLIDDAEA